MLRLFPFFRTSFLLFFFVLFLISNQISSLEKNLVQEAFKEIRSRNYIIDHSGAKISIYNLKYSCQGNHCQIIVNDKELTLSDLKRNSIEPANPEPLKKVMEVVNMEQPISQPPNPEKQNPESGVLKGITEAHNQIRRSKKLPELIWDDSLANYAKEWADYLKTKNCSPTYRALPNKYGESIAWAMGWNMTAKDVVKMWTESEKDFNVSTNQCREGKVCSLYTQLIWKNSQRLGCGMSSCSDTEIWVCNYDPPGNIPGQKPYE